MYFVTPRNFAKFNNDENFNYEYGTERASKMKVNFVPKKPGRFCCVIHNKGDNDIDVNEVVQSKNQTIEFMSASARTMDSAEPFSVCVYGVLVFCLWLK